MGHDRVDDYTWECVSLTYYHPKEWGKDNWGEEIKGQKSSLRKLFPLPIVSPSNADINNLHSMIIEPSVLRQYGLGANLIMNTDPTGSFLLELLKEPTTTAPSNALSPTLSHSSIIIRPG
jgi:hypothetical protein